MRILVSDGADRIFASAWDRFEIEVWSDAGRRITGFEDPAFHERPFDSDSPTSADNPPTHRMRALNVDSDERLWVVTWRRRGDWLDLMEERVGPRGEVRLEVTAGHDYFDIYDNQIDVIDLTSARVIARTRMAEGVVVDFLGDDALWVGEYRENGTSASPSGRSGSIRSRAPRPRRAHFCAGCGVPSHMYNQRSYPDSYPWCSVSTGTLIDCHNMTCHCSYNVVCEDGSGA